MEKDYSRLLLDFAAENFYSREHDENHILLEPAIRRSISASYYACFHLLTSKGIGYLTQLKGAQSIASRAFEHGVALNVFRQLTQKTVDDKGHVLWLHFTDDAKEYILELSECFQDLQTLRYKADYDLEYSLFEVDASWAISKADLFFEVFRILANTFPSDLGNLMAILLFKKTSLALKSGR